MTDQASIPQPRQDQFMSGALHVSPTKPKPNMRRRSALERLSQLFWSAWTISNSETHGSLVESFDAVDNSYLFAPVMDDEIPRQTRSTLQEHYHDTDERTPCKGCRTQGVICDGRRPRCSHCVKEQVLCFYVTPLRQARKRSRSAHLALE